MAAAASLTGKLRQGAFYWPAEVFVVVLTIALGIRALRAAAHAGATGTPGGGVRARLGLTVGLPVGWALAPSRMSDHAMVPFPVSLHPAALLVLAVAGWLLGLWVERVMAAWAPKVSRAHRRGAPGVRRRGGAAGRQTVYETQYIVILAHLTQDPAVAGPVVLTPAAAQRYLYAHFVVSGWLPVVVALLMVPPAGGRSRAPAPARVRRGRVTVAAILAGVVAGSLSYSLWAAVDRLQSRTGSTGVDLFALACGFGAGPAAAVAIWARTAPVTKGVPAALVVGLFKVWSPAGDVPMSWTPVNFVLGQVLEAARRWAWA